MGDMIYKNSAGTKRMQGAYISEADLAKRLSNMTYTGTGEYKYTIDTALTAADDFGCETQPKPYEEEIFNSNLTEVIMLLFEKGFISNAAVQQEIEVGFPAANLYMEKLEEFNLIEPLKGKRKRRNLSPKCIDDISAEVFELMKNHGYTKDDVQFTSTSITEPH
jgi:DNA segregation ATPase FtsK/SpoIIIE-like protein